jgi:hypothetical protein
MTSLHRVVRRGLVLLALAPTPLFAQAAAQAAKVRVRENLRSQPSGEVIGVLEPGLALQRAGAREGWLEVDVEGWVWMRSLQTTSAAGHDLVVSEPAGENLRERPSGAILGKFGHGTLLDEQERVTGWVRVRRRGWVWAASVDTTAARVTAAVSAPATPARAPTTTAPSSAGTSTPRAEGAATRTTAAAPPPSPRRGAASGRGGAAILARPGGDTIARAGADAPVQVLSREGGWARVRVEGWVWMPAGDSAADLTPVEAIPQQLAAEPDRFRGRVVSWDLQFLSLERAERIRTEFFEGEPFLLTRHPAGGYVYVAVSPDLLTEAGGLLPLERIHVVARVRTPKSALTGSPILDLMELERTRDRR